MNVIAHTNGLVSLQTESVDEVTKLASITSAATMLIGTPPTILDDLVVIAFNHDLYMNILAGLAGYQSMTEIAKSDPEDFGVRVDRIMHELKHLTIAITNSPASREMSAKVTSGAYE